MNAIGSLEDHPAGLFQADALTPVPLEGVKVRAEIVGHASRVTMSQRFHNGEQVPIEAVYVFPLPESAALSGLVVCVGERRIVGDVEERDKAFERYDDAMAAGHGAVLVDAERPNVFTVSVGNILPGQDVVIELRWVAQLPMEGDAIRFMLPTTVAPRYAPAEDRLGVSPTPAERVTPPVALDVPYGFELEVSVVLGCAVRAIDSPTHPVRFEIDGLRARVALSHGVAAMDRDFVLLVTPQQTGEPHALVERNADGLLTAAVMFVPRLSREHSPSEVVFLVDRSGSMGGSSIEQVRAALHLCLRGLREGDRFNIVGFGSRFSALFAESVPYTQAALEKASAHVDGLDADMGGTEILPALRSVLERPPHRGVRRDVVVLTDGEVTNEAAVVELAESHCGEARIFTFGIGYGASEHLVRSLARVTRGEAEFIHPGERIEPKVLRQFARLGTPAVRDVSVVWHGTSIALAAPHRPPSVFDGEAAVVYARFKAGGKVTVTLSGEAEGTAVSWSVAVDADTASAGDLLATLAARAAIRDLEEGTSALHDERGSAQRPRREARIASEIVALAKAHRLASTHTSFVAIETREDAADGAAAELRRVPVALTKGWGGLDRAAGAPRVPVPQMLNDLMADAVYCLTAAPQSRRPAPPQPSMEPRISRISGSDAPAASPESRPGPVQADSHASYRQLLALARLQHADGSWGLDRKLAHAIDVEQAVLQEAAAVADGVPDGGRIAATLAALRFLEIRASSMRDEWHLLAEKAHRWLEKALASCPPGMRERLEALLATVV